MTDLVYEAARLLLTCIVLLSFPVFAVVAIGDLLTGGWQK